MHEEEGKEREVDGLSTLARQAQDEIAEHEKKGKFRCCYLFPAIIPETLLAALHQCNDNSATAIKGSERERGIHFLFGERFF